MTECGSVEMTECGSVAIDKGSVEMTECGSVEMTECDSVEIDKGSVKMTTCEKAAQMYANISILQYYSFSRNEIAKPPPRAIVMERTSSEVTS